MQTRAVESNSDFHGRNNIDHSLALSTHSSAFDGGDNSSADVESLVYYFSIQIDPIPLSWKHYNFRADPLRSKMILKFMKFYSWCPNLSRTIDKERRDQLKRHLKIEKSKFSSILSSFMSARFKVLKARGWISGDCANLPVIYHECTDHWLEHTWDGHIEHGNKHMNRKKRSLEQTAIAPSFQRQKLTAPRTHILSAGEIRAVVNPESRIETMSPQDTQHSSSSRAAHGHEPIDEAGINGLISEDFVDNFIDLTTPDDSTDAIQSQNSISNRLQIRSGMPTFAEPSKTNKKESQDACFEAREFYALLDGLSESDMPESVGGTAASGVFGEIITAQENQTPASAIGGFTDQDSTFSASTTQADSITVQAPQILDSLVGRERSCRDACNSIVTELMELKPEHDRLCIDHDRLRKEVETLHEGNKEAYERLKKHHPPTLDLDLIENRQKLVSLEWTESRQRAWEELSLAMKEVEERYTGLQAQYSAKVVELRSLRAAIKTEKALFDGRMTAVASLLGKFGNRGVLTDPNSLWIAEYDMDGNEEHGEWEQSL